MAMPTTAVDRPAMGTRLHVLLIEAEPGAQVYVSDRIGELEAAWSRFVPTSDVSRLNRADGSAVPVSADTMHLMQTAVQLWQTTGGAFDPTMLPALAAAGYDRSFDDMGLVSGTADPGVGPSPGLAGLEVDDDRGTVRLPAGVTFDAGGFGKGLAADLVVDELVSSGLAGGALVNLGGDLRAAGAAPPAGWGITLEDPEGLTLGMTHGAVATSSTRKRRWHGPDGSLRHHVIDPRTGRSVAGAPRTVTVVASTATMAEALATWLMVAPDQARPRLADLQAAALSVTDAGDVQFDEDMEVFLW